MSHLNRWVRGKDMLTCGACTDQESRRQRPKAGVLHGQPVGEWTMLWGERGLGVEVSGVLLDGLEADCCCWSTEKKRIPS